MFLFPDYVLLLAIDGYVLAVGRTDPHFFVDGFIDWICYIHHLIDYVYLSFRLVDW